MKGCAGSETLQKPFPKERQVSGAVLCYFALKTGCAAMKSVRLRRAALTVGHEKFAIMHGSSFRDDCAAVPGRLTTSTWRYASSSARRSRGRISGRSFIRGGFRPTVLQRSGTRKSCVRDSSPVERPVSEHLISACASSGADGHLGVKTESTNIVPESVFHISRRMKTLIKKGTKSLLGRGTPERSGKGFPLGHNLCVGRQTIHVNHPLRLRYCLLVKRRYPFGESINECVELIVGH